MKRIIALLIDVFVIVAFHLLLNQFFNIKSYIIFVFLFIKDILFLNASLGKKIMGIAIFNRDFSKPTLLTVIKRSILTNTIGYLILYKAILYKEGELYHIVHSCF